MIKLEDYIYVSDEIKEALVIFDEIRQSTENNSINENDFADVIVGQYSKLITKTNKKLMKSLKKNPIGYGECTVRIDSKDMRKVVKKYYEKIGCQVEEDYEYSIWGEFLNDVFGINDQIKKKYYLIIRIKGWTDKL